MRHVMFFSGIRSEYDILYPVIRAVDASPRMRASVLVSGAHLAPMYGGSVREIEADGVVIAGRIETLLNADSPAGRVKSAAIQLSGIVDVLVNQRPDLVVAPMDREEAMTVALAGAYMGVPVVHLGGGDTSDDGNIDNAVRDAVTKLAHLHMVTTARSRERVVRLGEEPWRIHVVGAAGLDRLASEPQVADEALWTELGFRPDGPFILLIQHPIIATADRSGELMQTTMEALARIGAPVLAGYPNSDSGSQLIIEVIDRFARERPDVFHAHRNLPRHLFVNLLRRAAVLVGNSSAGIIEAPLFGLPTVNIGPRQRGREHASNVTFVDHDATAIEAAVRRGLTDEDQRAAARSAEKLYGDGTAGTRIATVLEDVPIDDRLLRKVSTF
jgi:GDP/UDP-N,N'-diacetylbacillosamine 2-epimerase (hydrolysing)